MDASGYKALMVAMQTHATGLGLFDSVNLHEPKNAPGNGLSCAIFYSGLKPARGASGLAAVSLLTLITTRVYLPMLGEPQDDIDPQIMGAVAALMLEYCGDFEFGGLVRNLDIFGAHGQPMDGRPGYINQDGKLFRTVDLVIAVVTNDELVESP